MDNNCPFCVELTTPELSIWNQKRNDLPLNRILYKKDGLVIMPPLGSFIPGGLLLLTESHYRCCSILDKSIALSMDTLITQTAEILRKTYKKNILFFEHGPGTCGSKGACCVDHAHINIFPIDFDIWRCLPKFNITKQIHSITDLNDFSNIEYLWLFDNNNNYAFPISGIPSQFIRTIITKQMHFPIKWNWQDYLGLDEIQLTLSDLQGKW
ncbi:hypothetical protein AGMMS49944_30940 [Spirochaetia bacterium]|nr:hypothetical protein AGMMS49944_30940 [Spirochaetia bacterium]